METASARGESSSGKIVHWTVRMNRRNRTWFSMLVFATVATHLAAQSYGPLAWVAAVLQFFGYPQLAYYRALLSRDQRRAEFNNLLLDGFFLGVWAAALGFPVWLTFIFLVSVTVNLTVFLGRTGFLQAFASVAVGTVPALLLTGLHFRPETTWPTTLLSIATIFVYVMLVAHNGYARAVQLHQARAQLRDSEQALKRQLDEIQQLQAQLREQANRDALTGLFNRRYFDSTLERELARCEREQQALSIVMIDIDHFKRINDDYGHPAGDEVIRVLARLLDQQVRASDCACRYGGEEFMLLLPGVEAKTASERAEQWRANFCDKTIRFDELQIGATLSIGIASYPDNGATADALVRAVDLALYRAKSVGRNRVVVAGRKAA